MDEHDDYNTLKQKIRAISPPSHIDHWFDQWFDYMYTTKKHVLEKMVSG